VVDGIPRDAPQDLIYYEVADTLIALGLLGRARRRQLGARVCAVAGSNGKTTTKDMLHAVLSPKYRVHATQGNLNNLIGAPLTLLRAPDDAEVIVAEIGTNSPGELARLAAIVEPDAAVITGISAEHLEGLGDLQGVLREETSVLPWVPLSGAVVVSDDPAMLAERARALHPRVRVAGLSEGADADLRGGDVTLDEEGRVRFRWSDRDVRLELRGRHNARNALVALGIAREWEVSDAEAVTALESLAASRMRVELRRVGGLTVIVTVTTPIPQASMPPPTCWRRCRAHGGRVAVLGSMLEMGSQSADIHREVAADVASRGFDLIVATGEFADAFGPHRAALGPRLVTAGDALDAWEPMAAVLKGDEVILLKGSRGVALERLLPRFEEKWGSLHPHGEALGSRGIDVVAGQRDEARPAEHPQEHQAGGPRDGADAAERGE
jgi:UDP-N-acetylmuramoyl-tripeptide--D-alanyl-D-alanine ligase